MIEAPFSIVMICQAIFNSVVKVSATKFCWTLVILDTYTVGLKKYLFLVKFSFIFESKGIGHIFGIDWLNMGS